MALVAAPRRLLSHCTPRRGPVALPPLTVRGGACACAGGVRLLSSRAAAGGPSCGGRLGAWVLDKLPPRAVRLGRHFVGFVRAYLKGGRLLAREGRVAARLFKRIYLSGHRYTRSERRLMRKSASDLAKTLPMAGLMLTLGLEISTFVVLRGMPGLLPSALRKTVVPEVDKITGAAETKATQMAEAAQERLETMSQAVDDVRAFAEKTQTGLATASEAERKELVAFIEQLDDAHVGLCYSDILEMAPLFRAHMTLDHMDRTQLRSLADFIIPSRANRVAPAVALRFNLRRHCQQLRVDDKDIYW